MTLQIETGANGTKHEAKNEKQRKTKSMIRPEWYGWVHEPTYIWKERNDGKWEQHINLAGGECRALGSIADSEPAHNGEREAFVRRVLDNGNLVINIKAIGGCTFEIPAQAFTPEPNAFWWSGHMPDEQEDIEERARVCGKMINEGWIPEEGWRLTLHGPISVEEHELGQVPRQLPMFPNSSKPGPSYVACVKQLLSEGQNVVAVRGDKTALDTYDGEVYIAASLLTWRAGIKPARDDNGNLYLTCISWKATDKFEKPSKIFRMDIEEENDRFGLCPICHREGNHLRDVFYCREHKLTWCTTSLFSAGPDDEAEWLRLGLSEFLDVEPYYNRDDSSGSERREPTASEAEPAL